MKNAASEPITHQEIAFALLILSGTMTDQQAAKAVGLHPASAAHLKTRPRVRAYLLEHSVKKAPVQQQTQDLPPQPWGREQVLTRLWQIANLGHETTRGSMTSQVKALSLIVAMEGLIPDRRASSPRTKSDTPPAPAPFYRAAWNREQEAETINPQSAPAVAPQEDEPGLAESEPNPAEPEPNAAAAADALPLTTPTTDRIKPGFASWPLGS